MAAIKQQKGANESATEKVADEETTIDVNTPFSQERLNVIFKKSKVDSDKLISRESSIVEFKESFGWKSLSKYLRTCAAFANTKGGYLVFGIGNKPHKLLGLSGNSLQSFKNFDPAKLSGYFNDYFAPEIHWGIHEYELDGKIYGLLCIHKCRDKPVVCKKNSENILKEGDIYYRYRGRSERIKYSELRNILEENRENEQKLWMHHLARIARIGVREAGIFDLKTGQVTGATGSFLIDESLLNQLSFIKEGEFSEVKGWPTLKLIGNLEVIDDSLSTDKTKILKVRGIRLPDIVLAFLKQESVHEPLEYIKQICFESSGFLPIYYFIKLSGVNKESVTAEIEGVISRSKAKSKVLERLEKNNTQSLNKPTTDNESAKKKRDYISQLKQNQINNGITDKEIEYCLQSIRMLQPAEVGEHSEYIRSLLNIWFNEHYSPASGTLANSLRRAICWVDEALYAEGI